MYNRAMRIIGNDWDEILKEEFEKEYYQNLRRFLDEEYKTQTIYPKAQDLYNALRLTPYSETKVVILGQDPYHEPNQAMGLAFSVPKTTRIPPSLVNIYKELFDDLKVPISQSGDLRPWAKQGVLLLNTVMTVRAHKAFSHAHKGWEELTDAMIKALNKRKKPLVFMLWGNPAKRKAEFITNPRHLILKSAHPSPLSAYNGFFGSKPFSKANAFLKESGQKEIDWRIE